MGPPPSLRAEALLEEALYIHSTRALYVGKIGAAIGGGAFDGRCDGGGGRI